MASVLARLVQLLAILCLCAGVSIVAHGCVWALLTFTEVRAHGIAAVTHPEKVASSTPGSHGEPGVVDPVSNTIISVKAEPSVVAATEAAAAPPAPAFAPTSTADAWLSVVAGVATVVGVASLVLLPVLLFVAFVTALVRAPHAAGASMGGVLWSITLLALVLPWSALWPQIPWAGLFVPYGALVLEVDAIRHGSGPFSFAVIMTHVAVPTAGIAVLVGIAWRCGEPLHAELMAEEALSVDVATERDASAATKRGARIAAGRAATGLSLATCGPIPSTGGSSDAAFEPAEEERPRRLI